jgi:hypothetical protein
VNWGIVSGSPRAGASQSQSGHQIFQVAQDRPAKLVSSSVYHYQRTAPVHENLFPEKQVTLRHKAGWTERKVAA